MDDLSRAVGAWRREPFPPGSPNNALDELHADLALADSWVADAVIPFVERGLFRPADTDVVDEARLLLVRASELRQQGDEQDAACSDRYSHYATLLIQAYEAFLAAGANSE